MEKNKTSFLVSWVLVIVLCSIAFYLLSIDKVEYGLTLFCALPIILGFTTGIMPNKRAAMFGLILSLICFGIGLLFLGLEGVVCLAMALPIVASLIFAGTLFSHFIGKSLKDKDKLKISLFSILLLGIFNFVELYMGDEKVLNTVSLTIPLNHTSDDVYNTIIAVDTVDAEKSFLHLLGLPLPTKCILTDNKIGGKRICKFTDGEIIEEITAMEPGKLLQMKVVEFKLKGRPWLHFEDDIYTLEQKNDQTFITRTTTYYSDLKPRFYWQFFEKLAIKAEQELVFKNLEKDLN